MTEFANIFSGSEGFGFGATFGGSSGSHSPNSARRPATVPSLAKRLAACQKSHGDTVPFWLRFPALSPYQEKRPPTREQMERLERLATPRPDRSLPPPPRQPPPQPLPWNTSPTDGEEGEEDESGDGDDAEKASVPPPQSAFPPKTPTNYAGPERPWCRCTFAPKIDSLWKLDWQTQMFEHDQAPQMQVIRWYNERIEEGAPKIKKGTPYEKGLAILPSCKHKDEALQETFVCITCRTRLCARCQLECCGKRRDNFLAMPMQQKQEALENYLNLQTWQARALLRNTAPAKTRLYPTPKVPGKGKRAGAQAPLTFASSPSRFADDGGDFLLKLKDREKTFQRLTTPREPPTWPPIPYLPGMIENIPPLDDLVDMGEVHDLESTLQALKAKRKLQDWQVTALLRCSVPVFERLTQAKG
mmetsp:Transcript_17186/g.36964  ORF Transcript_17186/g.36964 Transcript_17186/m.36964 type:complete len:416 (-) Transcript_17186:261-1508(-)|eukprot:CAMPEP_0206429684 /NCGR_PEP_ID=MMETSP0324_2-20121206/6377_1 /ASSEMBLY_ACC=CAM_ASM_000836 /TAXON_ID=2866 /ORGANISM="Crypthecodinium cohnii, Strain Seligo" /LENGTH=415 /DNA_ID=CAMNT_0053895391 /DNA_START=49 /DNA_END=1296 /DNA_ORIENTATION=-